MPKGMSVSSLQLILNYIASLMRNHFENVKFLKNVKKYLVFASDLFSV